MHTASVSDFSNFISASDWICGHNVIHHDIKYLPDYIGEQFKDRIIDTLYLSPLMFPKRPYHRLLKDDKLQVDELNNPVNDSQKAQTLFYDEVNAFFALPTGLKKIYCGLLYNFKEYKAFFDYVEFKPYKYKIAQMIKDEFQGKICENADMDVLVNHYSRELAYALALIYASDRYSVTPLWLQYNFPKIDNVIKFLCNTPCADNCEYCQSRLDVHRGLKEFFGFDEFRKYNGEPLQENAARAAVEGKSVLAVFPTGGGKSITFQLPALMAGKNAHGLTVVISPLQSLMKDQVDNLASKGIEDAVTINGMLDPIERADAIERVSNGQASLLYISPEMLRSKTIEKLLMSRNVVRFVIDEAHCFSAWDQDFRVDYLYIGDFIRKLQRSKQSDRKPIPVSCFTATAKQKVITDICDYFKKKLDLNLEIFASSATRENLHYTVLFKETDEEKYNALRSLIVQKNCPTIVYVSSTKRTFALAEKLSKDGLKALPYNGKMESKDKIENQEAFMNGDVFIIVATSAFGIIAAVMLTVLGGVSLLAHIYNLNNIKSKTVGDGQHGTARWANKSEIRKIYRHIPFTPERWREQAAKGKEPTMLDGKPLPQGIVVGCTGSKGTTAMVDTGDVHALMIGAAGVGKTAFWLYPCIEYACASGMSFLSTDTKGDVMRNYGNIAQNYGYSVSVIDLRNPTRSNGNNLLYLVNKYMDLYQENPDTLVYKAKAEKYAKIISKTIILSGMDAASFGQNAYFYDAAEGLLTATILLVAEFCEPQKRHIVSVFKIIQELLAPSQKKGKNQFQQLMEMLPNDHKAKWFAGAALNTAEQSMASVMSTALSRLNSFLDSELEQLLCFDTEIDAEKFCSEKSAIFVIMPEENPNTFFMISLIIQQLYREILAVADENGGKLKNRCVFFCDEFGTLPKIESAEMMFSASRSRRLQIVPIIQSFSQLEKNYGKEGGEIIVDNTQLTIFGGFAPNSSSAEVLSKALGSRTVMSGSVSRGKNDPSQSLQMIERPLLTPDELKSMPKGQFVVMKTGVHPMRVKLKLFFKWGIRFDEDNPYIVADNGGRKVEYAEKKEIMDGIIQKYHPEMAAVPISPEEAPSGGQNQQMSEKNVPKNRKPPTKERKSGGAGLQTTAPKNRRNNPPDIHHESEVQSNGQA